VCSFGELKIDLTPECQLYDDEPVVVNLVNVAEPISSNHKEPSCTPI
jgi:hypothetical protein